MVQEKAYVPFAAGIATAFEPVVKSPVEVIDVVANVTLCGV